MFITTSWQKTIALLIKRVRFPSGGFKTFLSRGTNDIFRPKCHEVNTRLDRPCRVTLVKTCVRLPPPVTPMMSSSLRIPIYRDAITCNLAHLRHDEIKITIHCSLSSFPDQSCSSIWFWMTATSSVVDFNIFFPLAARAHLRCLMTSGKHCP